MTTSGRPWILFAATTAGGLALDLATKAAAFRSLGMPGTAPPVVLLPGVLSIETNLNEGALFGMGQGLGLVFAAVSVAAIVGILAVLARPEARGRPLQTFALGLICGGILGNLFDRLGLAGLRWHAPPERTGAAVFAVRDWIHVVLPGVIDWPIFNLADSWLVIGAGLLLVLSLGPTGEPPSPAPAAVPLRDDPDAARTRG